MLQPCKKRVASVGKLPLRQGGPARRGCASSLQPHSAPAQVRNRDGTSLLPLVALLRLPGFLEQLEVLEQLHALEHGQVLEQLRVFLGERPLGGARVRAIRRRRWFRALLRLPGTAEE